MRRAVTAVSFGLIALLSGALLAQQTHPFSVHDMLAMDRVSDPQLAPDGSTVAFTLRTTDLEANRGRTDLWLVEMEGGSPRRLTTHEAADFHPRWSRDGEDLFFLSTRSGSSQIWRLPLTGGEPHQVTDLPLDVGNLVMSPGGRRIAVTMDVFADCETLACSAERLDDRASGPTSGVVHDELFVRHWDTWKDGRRSHIFVLDARRLRSRGTRAGGRDGGDWTQDCTARSRSAAPEEIHVYVRTAQAVIFSARDARG